MIELLALVGTVVLTIVFFSLVGVVIIILLNPRGFEDD